MAKTTQRKKPSKKREKELRQIAKNLFYLNLSAGATSDAVSVCETVSRGCGVDIPKEELTTDEGAWILEYMEEVANHDAKEEAIIPAITIVVMGLNFKVDRCRTYHTDEEGERGANLTFEEWAKELRTDDVQDPTVEEILVNNGWKDGYLYVGNGKHIVVMRTDYKGEPE